MTSVSAGHVILTTTKAVGSGRPQQEPNQGSLHQEPRALPTELPPPPPPLLPKLLGQTRSKTVNISLIFTPTGLTQNKKKYGMA